MRLSTFACAGDGVQLVQYSLAGMLVMASTSVVNTETKAAWEGKNLCQHTVLHHSPSSKKVRAGTQAGRSLIAGRNLVAGNEAEATGECCLLTCLACFLTVPGRPRVVLLMVSWPLPHQSSIKCIINFLAGRSDDSIFSIKGPSSKMILAFVKLP